MSHSVLSPSSAKRRKLCVASLAACKHLPEDRTNKAAALGSAKHALSEWCLKNPDRQTPDAHVGQTTEADGFTFEIDDEFADHVNMYVNGVRAIGGDQTYEEWVDTEPLWGIPGQGGILDMSATHMYDGVLDIGDAKFGFTPVDIEPNDQLDIYAAAKLAKLDPECVLYTKIRFHVFQPKRSDIPFTWESTREELMARITQLAQTERAAYRLWLNGTPEEIEAAKTPSDAACEWCPIRTECAARKQQLNGEFPDLLSGGAVAYDTLLTKPASVMTAEELTRALDRVDAVEKYIRDWADGLRAEGLRRAEAGNFPGWKVIEGRRGARAVPDADKPMFQMMVVAEIGQDAYEKPPLKTPTQLEKAFKRLGKLDVWKDIQDGPEDEHGVRRGGWVVQAPGAHSLARATEPGMPISEQIVNEFGLVETA